MIENGYLFAKDNKRLFVNVNIGCLGSCSYCYLPIMGYSNNKIIKSTKTSEEVINMINNSNLRINKDTLITFGCFCECFDKFNKEETIKLINYFLDKGNQVQVSTKKMLNYLDIKKIISHIKYYGQFILFVSSATISKHSIYERNTDIPDLRFKNFKFSKYFPVILYLKPVLKNITYKDISLYKDLIKSYNIKYVVVGSIYTKDNSLESVHFSSNNTLFYNEINDEFIIIDELKKICNVYRRSSEVCSLLKRIVS